MFRFDQPDRCAFCGQLIAPDEPKSGRGETAAHVRCADAALADDRFWDRIAAGMGDSAPPEPGQDASREPTRAVSGEAGGRPRAPSEPSQAGARSGCALALGILLAIVLLPHRLP